MILYSEHNHDKDGENKYFVVYHDPDIEGGKYCEIQFAYEIFNHMEWADCHNTTVEKLYLIKDNDINIECKFHGHWSDFNDPLKMWIETVHGKILDAVWTDEH